MNWRLDYRQLPYAACFLACVVVDLFYFPPTTIFPDEHRFLAEAIRLTTTGQFWTGHDSAWQMPGTALFEAIRLATNGQFWTGHDSAWEMPGTALFYAPAVQLFGAQAAVVPIRLAQAILLVIQAGLIALTARRIFGKSMAGFLAACITAVYPFLLYYQGLLLSETLFNTWFLAGIAALFWWRERGCRIDSALVVASFCFVAATLTKATLTILPPLLLAATAWLAGLGWRRTAVVLLAASCLYGAFMSPWWIRNAMLFHTFVPFTTSSTQNLYLGNNPHNRDAGIDWKSDVDPAAVAKMLALPDELQRRDAFAKAALDYIKENPARFLRAAVKKFIRFWNIVPNASEFRSGLYVIISAGSFGPILVLALVAALRCWRQWRLLAPLYLIIGYYTSVHMVTIASLRYRLPLEPLLIMLAAEPLSAVLQRLRKKPMQRAVS